MALFSMEQSPDEVFYKAPKSASMYVPVLKNMFDLK